MNKRDSLHQTRRHQRMRPCVPRLSGWVSAVIVVAPAWRERAPRASEGTCWRGVDVIDQIDPARALIGLRVDRDSFLSFL